jgi:hypothetical protein
MARSLTPRPRIAEDLSPSDPDYANAMRRARVQRSQVRAQRSAERFKAKGEDTLGGQFRLLVTDMAQRNEAFRNPPPVKRGGLMRGFKKNTSPV